VARERSRDVAPPPASAGTAAKSDPLPKHREPSGDPVAADRVPASAPGKLTSLAGTAQEIDPSGAVAADPIEPMARRVDHLMLDLQDDQGGYGRLRISLSGSTLRATLMPNDQAMADRLTVDIRQLHQSLQEQGFPTPKITVQNPPDAAGWNPAARQVVVDSGAAEPRGTNRHDADADRRERWNTPREQRQNQGRTPERPRDDSQGQDRRTS
jgi:hypothetical protein